MDTCVIFCAGGFSGLIEPLHDADLVIAADGGLVHLQQLGIAPQVILGDFDSLGYIPQGSTVFPVEKDDTDAMLAIRHGLSAGFRRFVLYGALDGPRLDHTVANLQALQFLADRGAIGYLAGCGQIATVVKNGTLEFSSTAEGILSVFALGEPVHGVTLEGLQYPLEQGTLTPGFPLGVSNHFTAAPARVTVENGSVLVIYDRTNALEVRHADL